jgi:effector-associated domain 1 (EAD1)-containing protein
MAMNDALTELDPLLDGPTMIRLREQLSGAFNLFELKELVLYNFNEDLDRTLNLNESNLDYTVDSLLEYRRRRGTLTRLLRAVRKARPEKIELINIIAQLCPGAMNDAQFESAAIAVVAQGVNKLDAMRKDASASAVVNDRLKRSHDEIKIVVTGLNDFRTYKNLHDALQRAQLRPYRELASKIEQLRTNPEIADELQPVVAELKTISNNVLQWVDGLSDDRDKYAREKEWADDLSRTIDSIGTALGENAPRTVRQGSMKIRSLLLLQQTHLNDEMQSCIRRLRLEKLIRLLDEIASATELPDKQRPALSDAKVKMEHLWDGLRGRVAVHSKWQEVEQQLWYADSASAAQVSPDFADEFEASWQNTREQIEPLWRLDPKAQWVVSTQRFGKFVDVALDSKPADLDSARTNYGRFSTLARLQFQNEDNELKGLCEKLLRLRDPLSNLLSG